MVKQAMPEEENNTSPQKKKAAFLSLCNGVNTVDAGFREYITHNVPNIYAFELLNNTTRHPGLNNDCLLPSPQLHIPFAVYNTMSDKERTDQLIQFFNDPSAKIGFDCGGASQISGVLYWFNKYRQNPQIYLEQRKSEGSKIEYFPPRTELQWISDNKILIVASESEELGPYCYSSGIANIVTTSPLTKQVHAAEIIALKRTLDALSTGKKYIAEGKITHIAGRPISPICGLMDAASSRMMANQDRTSTGSFQKNNGYMPIITTELYSFEDSFIGQTSSLELMPNKLKAASVLIINDDYVNPKNPKTTEIDVIKQVAAYATLKQLAQTYPHISIVTGNFAPSHSFPSLNTVGYPCLYGANTEINTDGSYKIEFTPEPIQAKINRNSDYNTFIKTNTTCEINAPLKITATSYKTSLIRYLKDWHTHQAVDLSNKDVVLHLDNMETHKPWLPGFQADEKNLGNLILTGALENASSISLHVNFTKGWSEENKQACAAGIHGSQHKDFYQHYPTYEDFIAKHPLFNSPYSPLIKRAEELTKDHGLKIRLTTESKGKEILVRDFTKTNKEDGITAKRKEGLWREKMSQENTTPNTNLTLN